MTTKGKKSVKGIQGKITLWMFYIAYTNKQITSQSQNVSLKFFEHKFAMESSPTNESTTKETKMYTYAKKYDEMHYTQSFRDEW